MAIKEFPALESADDNGILAIGGDLEVPSLLLAYRSGIFPWPMQGYPLLWWAVPERAVLFLEEFHISRSLAKEIKRAPYRISFDTDFREIISNCSDVPRKSSNGMSWITKEMMDGYCALFEAGYAYCVGAYENDTLVGGLYGVKIDNFVSAESMFHLKPNASKVALAALVDQLRSKGIKWIDLQVINPFTESLGACEVSREEFMRMLSQVVS